MKGGSKLGIMRFSSSDFNTLSVLKFEKELLMIRLQDTEHRTSSMLQAPSDNQIVLEWIDKRIREIEK